MERSEPAARGLQGPSYPRYTVWMLLVAILSGCPPTPTEPALGTAAPERSCEVTLEVDKPARAHTLQVAGSFNDWLPAALEDPDGDGVFERDLGALPAGEYAYKLLVDGEWEEVPPDVYTIWADGFENRKLAVPDCEEPGISVVEAAATPDGELSAVFQYLRAAGGGPPDDVSATIGGVPVTPAFDPSTGRIEVAASGLASGKHSVRVVADGASAWIPLWVEPEPFEWSSGLLYYVFTDRFRDGFDDGLGSTAGATEGTDFEGGDLYGALDALEEGYFDELGVRSIWLSPVYDNPEGSYPGTFGYLYTGYHGYWPISARDVEERIGGDQALHDFVDAAHAHGIRVVLDTVLNHVHEEHAWLDEHPEWFTADPCPCTSDPGACNWDTNPLGCWFTDYLPDLDYKNPEIVRQVVDDTLWWIETYDIDGLRVDAAKHMDHVILRTLSMEIRDRYETPGGAEFYLVGETFTGQGGQSLIMEYVADHELDGQFDFPLYWPLRNAVGKGWGWRGLASEVQASDAAYGESVHRMSAFLGNHDVGRYATDIAGCDGYDPYTTLFGYCPDLLDDGSTSMTDAQWNVVNRLAMSFAFVATQPGVPLLYYGDEIGLAGAGDPDNRRMMPWSGLSLGQTTLRTRFRQLGLARQEVTPLHRGTRRELWVDDTLYVLARVDGDDVAITALHTGASSRTTAVPIPTDLALEGVTLENATALENPMSVTVSGGTLSLTLDPWEYAVLATSR